MSIHGDKSLRILMFKLIWYRARLERSYSWSEGTHRTIENLLFTDGKAYGELTFPPNFRLTDPLFEQCLIFIRDITRRVAVCHPQNMPISFKGSKSEQHPHRERQGGLSGSVVLEWLLDHLTLDELHSSQARAVEQNVQKSNLETLVSSVIANSLHVRFVWLLSSFALARHQLQSHELSQSIRINGFCDNLDHLHDVVRVNSAQGINIIKVKLRGVEDLQTFCKKLNGLNHTRISFRLDANGALTPQQLIDVWRGMSEEMRGRISYFEEPCCLEDYRQFKDTGIPLAFDHFGGNFDKLIAESKYLNVKAVIIKPAEYGTLAKLRRVVGEIRKQRWTAVVTSSLESPFGIYSCWVLARLLGNGEVANGLSLYNYWPSSDDGDSSSVDESIITFAPQVKDGAIASWDYNAVKKGVLSQISIVKEVPIYKEFSEIV